MRPITPYIPTFTFLIASVWSLIWSFISGIFKLICKFFASLDRFILALGFGGRLDDIKDIFGPVKNDKS